MATPKSMVRLRKLMSGYYMRAMYTPRAIRKIAWITSGGPVEPLIAMGITPIYPENHGAMVGAQKIGQKFTEAAERLGFSRDLCSYARVDIGQALLKKGGINGKALPRPDFLLCCNNICGTVLKWYEAQARYFNVPLILLDTPFNYDDNDLDRIIEYVKKQYDYMIPELEKVSGRRLKEKKFRSVLRRAAAAVTLWNEVLSLAEHRPTPFTCFDAFIHLAPIVTLRGTQVVIDYYKFLKEELQDNMKKGIWAIENEKYRLLWDNLPIWYKMRKLSKVFANYGAALVASTYTNAWADNEINPDGDLRTLAAVYAKVYLNRSLESRVNTTVNLAQRFQTDGIIFHSNRSCKPYSFIQYDMKNEVARITGMPALVIESDMTDPRSFAEEQVLNRIQAFMETLLERKAAS